MSEFQSIECGVELRAGHDVGYLFTAMNNANELLIDRPLSAEVVIMTIVGRGAMSYDCQAAGNARASACWYSRERIAARKRRQLRVDVAEFVHRH